MTLPARPGYVNIILKAAQTSPAYLVKSSLQFQLLILASQCNGLEMQRKQISTEFQNFI